MQDKYLNAIETLLHSTDLHLRRVAADTLYKLIAEYTKLDHENYGLKTTIRNQYSKLNKYRNWTGDYGSKRR